MTDKFVFFSKSADLLPGKGSKEELNSNITYTKLKNIKNWRKVLSNFYLCDFVYENKTYGSVEHAFHGKKFKLIGEFDLAYKFTKESNSILSKSNGNEAQKMRKHVLMTHDQLINWNKVKYKYLYDILIAKFSQCKIANEVLLATKNAQLYHIISRSSDIQRWTNLEKIRDILQNDIIKIFKKLKQINYDIYDDNIQIDLSTFFIRLSNIINNKKYDIDNYKIPYLKQIKLYNCLVYLYLINYDCYTQIIKNQLNDIISSLLI